MKQIIRQLKSTTAIIIITSHKIQCTIWAFQFTGNKNLQALIEKITINIVRSNNKKIIIIREECMVFYRVHICKTLISTRKVPGLIHRETIMVENQLAFLIPEFIEISIFSVVNEKILKLFAYLLICILKRNICN